LRTGLLISLTAAPIGLGCPTGDGGSLAGDDDMGVDCETAAPCAEDQIVESESDLDVVAQCDSITGDLTIGEMDSLTDIDMPCLTTVSGSLLIHYNASLTTVDMSSLTTAGELSIYENGSLPGFEGLSSLSTLDSDLLIHNNNSLVSLDGLSSLWSVGRHLRISGNDCLSQAEAETFAEVIAVGTSSNVYGNGENHPCD
jgi:hypothetical protein